MIFFWRGNTFAHPPKRTFVKSGSPSLTRGMEGKVRSGFMISVPFCKVKRLDMTTRRSEVFFTGRKRLRGTLTPVGIEINYLSLFFSLSLSPTYCSMEVPYGSTSSCLQLDHIRTTIQCLQRGEMHLALIVQYCVHIWQTKFRLGDCPSKHHRVHRYPAAM